jgi:hypothetical protein
MEARAILKEHGRQNAKQKRKRQMQRRQANVIVADDAPQNDNDEPTAQKNEASIVIFRRAILKEHGRQNAKQKRKRQMQRRQANVTVAEDASQTDSDEPTATKKRGFHSDR